MASVSSSSSLLTLVARRNAILVTSRTFATASPASSARFPPPPPLSTQPTSFDFRRLHQKQRWVAKEEDTDYIQLFEESLGRDYKLNWAINKYQISPRDQAFRNLHVRGLQMFIAGRDKTRASHVSHPSVKQEQYVVGLTDAEGKPVTVGKAVTQEQFKTLFREVRKHLSDIDNLFVHDGRVGAEKVRVFTDNAAVGLALKHLLLPTPLGKPGEFQHGLTAYVVSSIEASTLGTVGLGANFTIFDVEKSNLFIIGNPSTQALRTGLSQSHSYSQRASGVVLPADVLISGNRQVLVLSQDNSFLQNLYESTNQNLVAGNNVLWSQNGLTPLWKGATFSSQASQGDLVENKGLITRELKPRELSGHPTTVVFFGDNLPKVSEGVSKLTTKQAVNNFNELLKSQFVFGQEASQLSTRFEELLTQSKAEAVLFNKKGSDTANFKSLL